MTTTAADLFDRHHVAVYRLLRRMTGSHELAQDLAQEVFVRVVQGVHRYQDQGKELAWVFHIARNVLADHRSRAEGTHGPLAELTDYGVECSQLAAFGFREAIGLLPEAEREVFLLRETAGFSYTDIAAICGITEEAVRSRLYRARRQLRQLLSGRLSADRDEAQRRQS